MFKGTVLCLPRSEAIRYASAYLRQSGVPVTEKCAPDVTHLLLPVPSFPQGDTYLAHVLTELPDDVIVSGGNLNSPLLEHYAAVDFLQDPFYQAQNAAITADCAIQIVTEKYPQISDLRILVLGWGRIGKCLGKKLEQLGAEVTISARKKTDLALIQALDHFPLPLEEVAQNATYFDVIMNTVPALILPNLQARNDALILELASKPGITGGNITEARGLPGKMAPERSGKLIAETFLRLSI